MIRLDVHDVPAVVAFVPQHFQEAVDDVAVDGPLQFNWVACEQVDCYVHPDRWVRDGHLAVNSFDLVGVSWV